MDAECERLFSARLELADDGRVFFVELRTIAIYRRLVSVSAVRECASVSVTDCVWRVYLLIIRDTTAIQN